MTFLLSKGRNAYCFWPMSKGGAALTNKFIATIADALRQCGLADGMTLSFHHHLRTGDPVVNFSLVAVSEKGIKKKKVK